MTDPIEQLRDDLARLDDPADRLRRIAAVRDDVTQIEREYVETRRVAILEARRGHPRLKWREIGKLFGVSAQRAETMSKQQPNNQRTEP